MHKAQLVEDAEQIMSGRQTFSDAKKKWEDYKEQKKAAIQAATAKWNDKKHQKAEWEKFKKHQVFFLAGTIIGIESKKVVSLVQFSQ